MFGLWTGQTGSGSGRTGVLLRVLWPGDGPGLERGDQFGTITFHRRRKTYREFRGKGRTWFAKACGEHVRPDYPAALVEAGTELISVVDRFKQISESGKRRANEKRDLIMGDAWWCVKSITR